MDGATNYEVNKVKVKKRKAWKHMKRKPQPLDSKLIDFSSVSKWLARKSYRFRNKMDRFHQIWGVPNFETHPLV